MLPAIANKHPIVCKSRNIIIKDDKIYLHSIERRILSMYFSSCREFLHNLINFMTLTSRINLAILATFIILEPVTYPSLDSRPNNFKIMDAGIHEMKSIPNQPCKYCLAMVLRSTTSSPKSSSYADMKLMIISIKNKPSSIRSNVFYHSVGALSSNPILMGIMMAWYMTITKMNKSHIIFNSEFGLIMQEGICWFSVSSRTSS